MNLKQYIKNKKEQQDMQRSVDSKQRAHCYNCYRPTYSCLCDQLVPFNTDIQFVLLMHPMESRREKTGTGRLTNACLNNCEVIIGVDFTNDERVNQLIDDSRYFPMVMYPGDNAINLSDGEFAYESLGDRVPLVFIIDGTWPCAKKMMKLSSNLHTIARICFTPKTGSKFEIKSQPHEMCLSTIEAVHFFLSEWERQGLQKFDKKHDTLLDVFTGMVNFQKRCALDPDIKSYRKGRYKELHEKKPSKKWEKRKLFFD